jgi:hypothetical protein
MVIAVRKAVPLRIRLLGAWWVLVGKTQMGTKAYHYRIPVDPFSWVCARCGKGFDNSLHPPPHQSGWRMTHVCLSKRDHFRAKGVWPWRSRRPRI